MTVLRPHLETRAWSSVVLVVFGLLLSCASEARSQSKKPSRQVTVFTIVATPNNTAIDPRLEEVAPQLRELLPNHGFRLLDVKTKRLVSGQAVTCKLGNGVLAETTLVRPLDEDGKVQLHCELLKNNISQLATDVTTPPNQLFFLDKMLDNGSRWLIGIGAR